MIREIMTTLGYECSCCGCCFEFPFDAYSHRCYRGIDYNTQTTAKTQLAQLKLETFKDDGTHAGIVLSEPQPIEIVPDLIALRRSVRKSIGMWS